MSELKRTKELGLQTLIEVGPTRDAAGIREVSLASGVNVVCCTGFYVLKEEQLNFSVEDCEERMVSEIEEGIQGTGIRPGVIKVATKFHILAKERRVKINAIAQGGRKIRSGANLIIYIFRGYLAEGRT
ncbi:MAG: hypothetical protein U5K79_01875 [Cyclobacteriaceae bacterium]|nr:hypothetical protein [Cyclobacteriaceae bacterium]